uniref:Uncharacterized protein n=1 Tax=viral metagenome TaxID=1070528 RepID=A0A6C0LFQ7_9ZZZZ
MLKCNCNELCFYYKETSIVEIDGKKYVQTHNFNKCNRLLNENSKKKQCDFNSKIFINEKLVEEKNKNPIIIEEKNNEKILTYGDVRNKINDMFEFYYIKISNYFGNLNYNLKLIGYDAHDPTIETLSELKIRLSRKPNNVTKIYMNKESYFSHSIGEFDYDYDNEEQIFKSIKRGDYPLKWTKNKIVQDLLKIKVYKHKKLSKSKKHDKYIKSTKCYKVTSIEKLMKDEEDHQKEKDVKEKDVKEKDVKDEDVKDEDEEDDDEEEDKNIENLKDNEFDVEELSDDDEYGDNDYEDFSD